MTNDEPRTLRIESKLQLPHRPLHALRRAHAANARVVPAHVRRRQGAHSVVFEPRVGGALYENWGDGAGHLYGWVTAFDPPHRLRAPYMADARDDDGHALRAHQGRRRDEALGVAYRRRTSCSDEEAAGISQFGDLANFADAIRAVVEAA